MSGLARAASQGRRRRGSQSHRRRSRPVGGRLAPLRGSSRGRRSAPCAGRLAALLGGAIHPAGGVGGSLTPVSRPFVGANSTVMLGPSAGAARGCCGSPPTVIWRRPRRGRRRPTGSVKTFRSTPSNPLRRTPGGAAGPAPPQRSSRTPAARRIAARHEVVSAPLGRRLLRPAGLVSGRRSAGFSGRPRLVSGGASRSFHSRRRSHFEGRAGACCGSSGARLHRTPAVIHAAVGTSCRAFLGRRVPCPRGQAFGSATTVFRPPRQPGFRARPEGRFRGWPHSPRGRSRSPFAASPRRRDRHSQRTVSGHPDGPSLPAP